MTILGESEDRFHNLESPGSYEWSYFDGLSDDAEWGFVAIWFRGCPMSPYYTAAIDHHRRHPGSPPPGADDYAAFNLNIYHRGRRIYYLLHEEPRHRVAFDDAGADARVGSNAVRGGRTSSGGTYLLYLDTKLALGRGRLVGDLEIVSRAHDLSSLAAPYNPTDRGHFWVPAALDGRFTARLDLWRAGRGLRKLRFSGRAYHDRNFGAEPLHLLRADWHWGRVHSERGVFVYFSVAPDAPASPPFQQIIHLHDGKLLHGGGFTLRESARRRHWATLPYPEKLAGEGDGGSPRFTVERRSHLDGGPFYHRLLSRIGVDGGPEGMGITEFLRPDRLGVAAFRPFVKFRVRRKG